MEYHKKPKYKQETSFVQFSDDQDYWFFFFSLVFITTTLILAWVLLEVKGELPQSVPYFDALIIVLASFRLTRLFVYDSIMKFVRNWFLARKTHWNKEKEEYVTGLYEPVQGPKKTLWHLANCPWCAGVWFALLVVFFYFLTPYTWIAIFIFAVAGAASVLQIFSNLLGWNAELRKEKARQYNKKQDKIDV